MLLFHQDDLTFNVRAFLHSFKAFIKPFEAPQRSKKINIQLNFFSLSGIETGRVKHGNIY